MVVYYHWDGGRPGLQYGYVGVDLFFVISGFIMASSTQDSDGSARYVLAFYRRRLMRIWPTYFVLSLIVFALSSPGELSRFIRSVLFVPLWQVETTIPPGWSLPYEVLFYLIFGASLLAGRHRWGVLAALMSAMLLGLPALYGHFSPIAGPAFSGDLWFGYLAAITQPFMWSFMMGVVVFLISRRGFSISWTACASVLGAGALLAGWVYSKAPPTHDPIIGGFFAIAVLALALLNNHSAIRVPLPLTRLGDISFSLYLVHYPIKQLMTTKFAFLATSNMAWWIMVAVYLAVSFCLATISRSVLEIGIPSAIRMARSRIPDLRSPVSAR